MPKYAACNKAGALPSTHLQSHKWSILRGVAEKTVHFPKREMIRSLGVVSCDAISTRNSGNYLSYCSEEEIFGLTQAQACAICIQIYF